MSGRTYEADAHLVLVTSFFDEGAQGAGTSTPEIQNGGVHQVTCSAATRTIAAPLFRGGAVSTDVVAPGTRLAVRVKNTSGGALTLTWNAVYKVVNTAPATANFRVYEFVWDGTNWCQIGATADVAN